LKIELELDVALFQRPLALESAHRDDRVSPRAMSGVLNADRGRAMMKIYHASSIALAALVPAAAAMPEGQLAIDLALGAAMPVHSHIAMNFVRARCERRDAARTRAARSVRARRRATRATRRDGERSTDERRASDGTQIISDYAPKRARGPTRAATLALTVATAVGLFKLNTQGDGITRTVKSLWKA